MQEETFRAWLRDVLELPVGYVATLASQCKRVEGSEGDLDSHWKTDRLDELLDLLTYSREDERDGVSPRIPIDGDVYNGMSVLKSAVTHYRHFLEAQDDERAEDSAAAGDDSRPCWFVGAFQDRQDQTARFLNEGIWENGYTDRYLEQVKSMQPGDRIAIKAAYTKKHALPFAYGGRTASAMRIKATGTVTRNHGDGCLVYVDWTPEEPPRVWYFYTHLKTVWEVSRGAGALPWAAEALIRFAFEGAQQDYDVFLDSEWRPEEDEEEPVSEDARPEPLYEADLRSLADELLYNISDLRTITQLLDDKRQVIFQGPPGTGKTYAAQRLARHLAGSDRRVKLVQFHPSYAYEDFVQGFRPTLHGDRPGFRLRRGPLLRAADAAREEPQAPHFLVIDEINRGNLAKVLGELYFLLEYRDDTIRLQYASHDDESFGLPRNLYVIGTMNTADRSIALVDLALRRRFHFVEFHPDKAPIKGLLGRWLERHARGMEWLPALVDLTNGKLDRGGDRHAAIGPTYFMKKDLDEDKLALIWTHNVLPYIEERLYGQSDRLAEFNLKTLRREAAGGDSRQHESGDGSPRDGGADDQAAPHSATDEDPTNDAPA